MALVASVDARDVFLQRCHAEGSGGAIACEDVTTAVLHNVAAWNATSDITGGVLMLKTTQLNASQLSFVQGSGSDSVVQILGTQCNPSLTSPRVTSHDATGWCVELLWHSQSHAACVCVCVFVA